MSEVRETIAVLRPLWFLMPGGMPVRASGKARPNGRPILWCREGDPRWSPIDELADATSNIPD